MTWFNKYWDVVDDYYWGLYRLGVEPIPKDQIETDGEFTKFPNEFLNKNGGRILRRVGTAKENLHHLTADEAALNHALNFAFAIAADQLVAELLFSWLSITPEGEIVSIDKDVCGHFGWKRNDNITQHDGFYVSANAALGLEVKLGAETKLDQIAKYAFLLSNEERRAGSIKDAGLLYVTPDSRVSKVEKVFGDRETLADRIIAVAGERDKKRILDREILERESEYRDLIDRLKLRVISWADLRDKAVEMKVSLPAGSPGNDTARKLLAGLVLAIEQHRGTEVSGS